MNKKHFDLTIGMFAFLIGLVLVASEPTITANVAAASGADSGGMSTQAIIIGVLFMIVGIVVFFAYTKHNKDEQTMNTVSNASNNASTISPAITTTMSAGLTNNSSQPTTSAVVSAPIVPPVAPTAVPTSGPAPIASSTIIQPPVNNLQNNTTQDASNIVLPNFKTANPIRRIIKRPVAKVAHKSVVKHVVKKPVHKIVAKKAIAKKVSKPMHVVKKVAKSIKKARR